MTVPRREREARRASIRSTPPIPNEASPHTGSREGGGGLGA